ncbi:MAG: hypothetical protein JW718_00305 [Desulfovibrionaceae bacterium]|nr:hypothetical protein [Desulfovibrionaceae bacterium]
MFEPRVQLDFLRVIQDTFARGSTKTDVDKVILQFFVLLIPLILLFLIWYYYHFLSFYLRWLAGKFRRRKSREKIRNYFLSQNVRLQVVLVDRSGPIPLCSATVASFEKGRMVLDVESARSVRFRLVGRRVVCFCNPFQVGGRKYNSFESYVLGARWVGPGLAALRLFSPPGFRYSVRRKHRRKRIGRPGVIKVRVWSGAKVGNLMATTPDFETPDPGQEGQATNLAEVVNISAGGMRLNLTLGEGAAAPRQGDDLGLLVGVLDPDKRLHKTFIIMGSVQSVFPAKGGAVGVGVKFNSQGRTRGDGTLIHWTKVGEEVKDLAEVMAKLERKHKVRL